MKAILFLFCLALAACSNLRQTATVSQMVTNMLNKHNYYRAQHQVGNLALLSALTTMAQASANDMAAKNTFEHTGKTYNGNYCGENLYKCWTTASSCISTGEEAVVDWYNEISAYNFNKQGFSSETGHFTQVVWKNTKNLGCGVANGKDGSWTTTTVVCNYYPGGNYLGQFEANVFPKK